MPAASGRAIIEMPVTHHPRRAARPSTAWSAPSRSILDLFTVKFLISYANKPIYLFGGLGFLLGLASVGVLVILGCGACSTTSTWSGRRCCCWS